MRIGMITPAPPGSRYGNRVTALRWARILRDLGHRVTLAQAYEGEPYDLLVALHARRSYAAIGRFHREHPKAPLIVALTGTDLYRDLRTSRQAQKSLELATRLILLQPEGLAELRPALRRKVRVIYQSVAITSSAAQPVLREGSTRLATAPRAGSSVSPQRLRRAGVSSNVLRTRRTFDVCVIGHLRTVKDPFRAALASRLLPSASRVRVLHIGGAMSPAMAARARTEMKVNLRYRWLGEQPRWRVYRVLVQSHLCVLSSRMEGGANVLSEAIVASVPIVASRIPGTIGILGHDYPGYFDVGDTSKLARLLRRAETDPVFLAQLRTRCEKLAPIFDPRHERAAWADLVGELSEAVYHPSSEPSCQKNSRLGSSPIIVRV